MKGRETQEKRKGRQSKWNLTKLIRLRAQASSEDKLDSTALPISKGQGNEVITSLIWQGPGTVVEELSGARPVYCVLKGTQYFYFSTRERC